jgi:molecular chaperone GrpE
MSDGDELRPVTQEPAYQEGLQASTASSFVVEDEPGLELLEALAQEDRPEDGPDMTAGASATADGAGSALDDRRVRDALKELGEDMARRLELLRAMFERESRAEATRERVIDRLHAELQEYKQDLLLKVQRPIFVDLIQLHDDIGKMIEARVSSGSDPEQPAPVRGLLESIQTAIDDILYRQGVEPFTLEGTDFDPRKQRVIATLPTDDPALNKTIAARVRKGFQAGEKLIRPEIVTVYTARPAIPPSGA